MAIIDFLYCGEANVYQENLDSFLSIAEDLKMKGLENESLVKHLKEEWGGSLELGQISDPRESDDLKEKDLTKAYWMLHIYYFIFYCCFI